MVGMSPKTLHFVTPPCRARKVQGISNWSVIFLSERSMAQVQCWFKSPREQQFHAHLCALLCNSSHILWVLLEVALPRRPWRCWKKVKSLSCSSSVPPFCWMIIWPWFRKSCAVAWLCRGGCLVPSLPMECVSAPWLKFSAL